MIEPPKCESCGLPASITRLEGYDDGARQTRTLCEVCDAQAANTKPPAAVILYRVVWLPVTLCLLVWLISMALGFSPRPGFGKSQIIMLIVGFVLLNVGGVLRNLFTIGLGIAACVLALFADHVFALL